jgi:nucleotide-binding universal stress UspA family protein
MRPPCDELAARSHAPVAVVPDLWAGGTPPGSLVVLGLDAPRRRPELVREAVALAQARRAALRVVHAWWSPLVRSDLRVNQERADRWEVEAGDVLAQALVDLPEGPRIPVELQVAHGRPAEVLTAAARPACLLVVGRGRAEQHGVGPHAGPVPAALVHDAACPVALLPPGLDVPSTGPAVMHELGQAGQLA